ncbi:glycoside hydrolase [Lysobacter sp. 5GHs7-4]|uniref:sialidase family protein n=1 Tax=Lysobacter sp. 5GHs7-4 TaxID=2904253 RepID=UPI001E451085|nr:sialidase family protein [Lysobacter sp. 5GHs7-4]UHQ23292.1 glycoside hydrolase [Lysobacter sp. 5GHs7-4]
MGLVLALSMAACERAEPTSADAPAVAIAAAAPRLSASAWTLPAPDAAAQPDLVATSDGRLLLLWIEPQGDGHRLLLAQSRDAAHADWSAPTQVAAGDDWFVNWADTPHVMATDDGALWAHWLRKSASAPYAYDVALARSGDDGATWSAPVLVNDDGTATEHGFVSLWPAARDRLGIAWLDGRHNAAAPAADAHAGHDAHGGAMTLRSAIVDAALRRSDEVELDRMTCDCCQTDVALTERGALLVYRDRSAEEIRDIAALRRGDGGWGAARNVHPDRWTMPACPVNGPAVAARGARAVVAWYTAAGDEPVLKLARSDDAGDSYAAPKVLDRGAHLQGRVDTAMDRDAVWVLWLREDAQGQSLQLARYAADLSGEPQQLEVARLQGRGRATGFPQLALTDGVAHVAWTDVVDGRPLVRGARIVAR